MKKTSKYKIIFSSAALTDIKEAASWYNSQQKSLGKRFKQEVKTAISYILSNPFHASIKYETIRTVACRIFPYSIHYEVNEAESIIRVISIFHFSRKPNWLTED